MDVLGDSEVHNEIDEHNNINSHSGITKRIDELTKLLRLAFIVTPKTWAVLELMQVVVRGEWKAN